MLDGCKLVNLKHNYRKYNKPAYIQVFTFNIELDIPIIRLINHMIAYNLSYITAIVRPSK